MPKQPNKTGDRKLCRVLEEIERGNRIASEHLAEARRTNALLERIVGTLETDGARLCEEAYALKKRGAKYGPSRAGGIPLRGKVPNQPL